MMQDGVVKSLTDGVAFLFKKNKVTAVHGEAKRRRAAVAVKLADGKSQTLQAKHLRWTGSERHRCRGAVRRHQRRQLNGGSWPSTRCRLIIIVVGGGYIGLELGSVWARLGAKVTVLEFLPHILPLTDREIAGLLQKSLVKQGLTFHTETAVKSANEKDGQVIVSAVARGENQTFPGDKVLVAVGRRPFTAGLGLKEAGVDFEERSGRVTVNEAYQTSVPNIYAIGDLISGPMLAHKAEDEGMACAERLAGKADTSDTSRFPASSTPGRRCRASG